MDNQLPAFVLAGLYKNSLVITGDISVQPPKQAVQVTENDAVATPENTQAAQKKWYLGDNKKGIVVVAADDNAVFINDEWLDTLGKMLAGLKINFGDTAIVNLYNHPITFNAPGLCAAFAVVATAWQWSASNNTLSNGPSKVSTNVLTYPIGEHGER